MGDPTLQELYFLDSLDFIANPKSAIFILLFLSKIFAGFKSLWIILLELISEVPQTTCLKYSTAYFSGMPFLDEMSLERSPPSQNSVMMQVLFLVVQMSQTSIMFLDFLKVLSTQISDARRLLCTSPFNMRISMTLMATVSPELYNSYLSHRSYPCTLCSSTLFLHCDLSSKSSLLASCECYRSRYFSALEMS